MSPQNIPFALLFIGNLKSFRVGLFSILTLRDTFLQITFSSAFQLFFEGGFFVFSYLSKVISQLISLKITSVLKRAGIVFL